MIAKCRACHTLFDAYAAPDGTELPPSVPRPPRLEAPDAKLPEDVTLDPGRRPVPAGYRIAPGDDGAPLRITLPTSRAMRREGCGCVMYLAVLIGVVVLFVRGDLHDLNAAILGFVIVVFSYVLFASMVNTTIVTADESEVRVRSGPLPLWPAKAVASAELEQLFVVSGTYRDPPREHSVLTALLKDGSRRALLVSAQGEDLLFIEKTVERRLGIVDRPVPDASAADRQA